MEKFHKIYRAQYEKQHSNHQNSTSHGKNNIYLYVWHNVYMC